MLSCRRVTRRSKRRRSAWLGCLADGGGAGGGGEGSLSSSPGSSIAGTGSVVLFERSGALEAVEPAEHELLKQRRPAMQARGQGWVVRRKLELVDEHVVPGEREVGVRRGAAVVRTRTDGRRREDLQVLTEDREHVRPGAEINDCSAGLAELLGQGTRRRADLQRVLLIDPAERRGDGHAAQNPLQPDGSRRRAGHPHLQDGRANDEAPHLDAVEEAGRHGHADGRRERHVEHAGREAGREDLQAGGRLDVVVLGCRGQLGRFGGDRELLQDLLAVLRGAELDIRQQLRVPVLARAHQRSPRGVRATHEQVHPGCGP
jgi:hypothetical protein